MGKILSKLQDIFGELHLSPARLIMVGLDGAGKTTILYKIKLENEDIETLPTAGFNVETVTVCKNVTFTVWDVGGQEKLRRLWSLYFKGSHGILFVVDSSDKERMREAKDELQRLLKAEELKGVPMIVIANKQDIKGALSTSKIADWLGLGDIKDRYWCVQGTCATRGEGLLECMTTMATLVKNYGNPREELQEEQCEMEEIQLHIESREIVQMFAVQFSMPIYLQNKCYVLFVLCCRQ